MSVVPLVHCFNDMLHIFSDSVLVNLHDNTLAEQIAILSTLQDDDDAELFSDVDGDLEDALQEYLLKFFHWRENNKSQIMKKIYVIQFISF